MKDITASSKQGRNLFYPKKRPSPHRDGVAKSRSKQTPPSNSAYRTPAIIKAELQRKREAQILAFRREGIFIEEEYRDEISFYMHEMERYTMSSATSMDQQPEIRWHMRPCLVDFLVEIHFTFRLRPETLYLTLNIVDRYVSRRIVYTKHYQLVGCAALWIAAKFEDAKERVPTVQDLVHICRQTYDESAFIQMEGHVLATIQWTLGHPTAEAWLRLYCCGACVEDTKVQHVARFLMEITLFYREFVKFAPSAIALASLVLARYTCHMPRRAYEESATCVEIVELLDDRLAKHVADLSETLIKKYAFGFYSKASTHIVQWYLTGNRFSRQPLQTLPPITPVSSRTPLSALSTPMSAMTVSSDLSSDDAMPVTPIHSTVASDPFMIIHATPQSDKENMRTSYEPVILAKHNLNVSEDFLGHHANDCQMSSFGRPALHDFDLNVAAQSPVRRVVA
ncbi:hypothetical protein BD410DRAFT_712394 [Rickenella mellea]|uniref:Uncharacterized protein n=1 Tax=Rickenella mellea TaxID=50990 RepID=A0A4Y7QLZ9_9AGAM|nr:hypothetical protein BD410DRAFT_712394 [Rickenella mellea]